MMQMKRNYLFLVILFGLIIGLFFAGIRYFLGIRQENQVKITYKLTKIVEISLKKFKHRFDYGDIENTNRDGAFSCSQLIKNSSKINHYYFRCNSDFLNCFFDKGTMVNNPDIFVQYQGRDYFVYAKKSFNHQKSYTQSALLDGQRGVVLELGVRGFSNFSFFVFLESTCHELYLPQRAYGYGPNDKVDHFIFDNIGEDIVVDKFMVSLRDVFKWMEKTKVKLNKKFLEIYHEKKNQPLEFPHPAYFLTASEMEQYCQDQGKEILKARYFDAASFYPLEKENYNIQYIARSSYPFQKYEGLVFREKFLLIDKLKRKDFLEKLTKDQCQKIYSKECLGKYPFEFFSPKGMGYTGISQTLGFLLEYTPNDVEKKKNLNLSSYYFPLISNVHKIGIRGYWNGEGSDKRNFSFGDEFYQDVDAIENFKVGFRCMKRIIKNQDNLGLKEQESTEIKEVEKPNFVNSHNFYEFYYTKFLTSDFVQILNQELWGDHQKITPQNSWFPLFKIRAYSLTNKNNEIYCLYYKFGSKDQKNLGAFHIQNFANTSECPDKSFQDNEASLINILDKSFSYNEKRRRLDLFFKFKNGDQQKHSFTFANILKKDEEDSEKINRKFKPHTPKTNLRYKGVWILGVNEKRPELEWEKKSAIAPCGGKNEVPCFRGNLFLEEKRFFCGDDLKIYQISNKKKVCL